MLLSRPDEGGLKSGGGGGPEDLTVLDEQDHLAG